MPNIIQSNVGWKTIIPVDNPEYLFEIEKIKFFPEDFLSREYSENVRCL